MKQRTHNIKRKLEKSYYGQHTPRNVIVYLLCGLGDLGKRGPSSVRRLKNKHLFARLVGCLAAFPQFPLFSPCRIAKTMCSDVVIEKSKAPLESIGLV